MCSTISMLNISAPVILSAHVGYCQTLTVIRKIVKIWESKRGGKRHNYNWLNWDTGNSLALRVWSNTQPCTTFTLYYTSWVMRCPCVLLSILTGLPLESSFPWEAMLQLHWSPLLCVQQFHSRLYCLNSMAQFPLVYNSSKALRVVSSSSQLFV